MAEPELLVQGHDFRTPLSVYIATPRVGIV